MKKLLIAILVATMLFAAIIPLSAAEASPVKDYATAQNGELLYTVNFKGDSVFTPTALGNAGDRFEYTPSEDGSELTVKGKAGGPTSSQNFWGGTITGLVATTQTQYTMVYKVRANGTVGKDNSVGVGGWIPDGDFALTGADTGTTNIKGGYNNYGNHSTKTDKGVISDRRSALSNGSGKIADYIKWSSLEAYDVDPNGFVTMMLEFNVEEGKFSSYILKQYASDMTNSKSWIKIERKSMNINDDTPDNLAFMVYSCYNVVDTTIKDVKIYKGTVYTHTNDTVATIIPETTEAPATSEAPTTTEKPKTTKKPVTKKPATTVAATVAPTEAPATTVAEEGGCGSSIALSGVAMIATVGTITAFVTRKKED